MTSSAAKVIATCLLLSISMQMCCGSAIPIWEFLTRTEKMSHLYTTFAQLVSVHCKATAAATSTPVNECKRDLLAYGYEDLQTFSEDKLDALDPYQRGANELIWSAIMRDHPSSTLITTRKPSVPTPPASSLIILTHPKAPKDEAAGVGPTDSSPSTTTAGNYGQNPIFNGDRNNHKYAMGMDMAYGHGFTDSAQQSHEDSTTQAKTYLTGPLVFRVRPDGTPVEEDQYKPLPRDDDLEAFQSTPIVAGNGGGKHRKIATISALKERLMGVYQYLQPPFEGHSAAQRMRRQPQTVAAALINPSGYFYGPGQA